MILADVDILQRVEKGEVGIEPFSREQLSSVGYDLCLHENFRVFKSGDTTHVDVAEEFEVTELVKTDPKKGSFVIHPGQFVLGSTKEKVRLPNNLVGLLEGRSSLGRLGLIVHATAALFDPGFAGHVTFEMSNISQLPVKLYVGMRVAQMVFVQTSRPVERDYAGKKGKYAGQEPPTSSRIWKDFE